MSNVRNWYIYITSAISLNSFLWAVIAMLRNLTNPDSIRADRDYLALQIAIIIIGLPIFIIHWNWAQRLSRESKEEQRSPLRRFYLYAILTGTLAPILANVFTFFARGLDAFAESLIFLLVTAIPLGVIFYYHQTIINGDSTELPVAGVNASIRRVYNFGFGAAGLWMVIQGASNLLHWLFLELSSSSTMITRLFNDGMASEVTRLLLGLAIWLFFWKWIQSAFKSGRADEQRSTLRKSYLYVTVFITSISAVWAASSIFAGWLRRLLDVTSRFAEEGPELGFALIIAAGVMWAYHSAVLQKDALTETDQTVQSSVRRIYLYLVAGVGLGALLAGLLGITMALVDLTTSSTSFGDAIKEQIAWATAAIIAGLPVWLLPWKKAQSEAVESAAGSVAERRSLTRRIYLYLFLFLAVMSVLGGLINIVYQILLLVLGERTSAGLLNDLAQALSFALIGLSVLGYHGGILRGDTRLEKSEQDYLMQDFKLTLLATGDGQLGAALKAAISAEFPHIELTSIGLTKEATTALDSSISDKDAKKSIQTSDLIVGPWEITVNKDIQNISSVVVDSPASKLLLPSQVEGWQWAGVDDLKQDDLVEQTVQAVKQILEGDKVKLVRSLGLAGIAVILVGALCLLSMIISFIDEFLFL